MFTRSTFTRIVSGSGTLNPPTGARAMRVAVIGAGGSGFAQTINATTRAVHGGFGGGCAASKIVLAQPIDYTIGDGGIAPAIGATGKAGGDTTASFGSTTLIGPGGPGGSLIASSSSAFAPMPNTGDYNFRAGAILHAYTTSTDSIVSSGSGAAGPNGGGGRGGRRTATTTNPESGGFSGTGWGAGGGAGGIHGILSARFLCGGAGTGAASGSRKALSSDERNSGGLVWGLASDSLLPLSGGGATVAISGGGEMGGGGSAGYFTNDSGALAGPVVSGGGSGGLVVEWFYVD